MKLEPKIERVRQRARELVTAVAAAKQAAAEVTAVATSGDLDDYFTMDGTTEPDPGRGITRAEYDGMVTSIDAVENFVTTGWHWTNLYKGASQ